MNELFLFPFPLQHNFWPTGGTVVTALNRRRKSVLHTQVWILVNILQLISFPKYV